MFITLEGGEGAGKSTLIEGLRAYFESKGKDVVVTREPGGTVLGEEIRNLLLHTKVKLSPESELQLFLASRAQHLAEVIVPALDAGKVVLCDRFNDSSVAYQGYARGLGEERVRLQCSLASGGVAPDATFYLDIEPSEAFKRLEEGLDRIESEEQSFHNEVREGYLAIARAEPERVRVLDATKAPKAVQDGAIAHLEQRLATV